MSIKSLKNFIINGFNTIKSSNDLTHENKVESIGYLFGIGSLIGILPGWRPKAISHNALLLFIENKFMLPKGLERAHELHRRDTFDQLINNNWKSDEECGNFTMKETSLFYLLDLKIEMNETFIKLKNIKFLSMKIYFKGKE